MGEILQVLGHNSNSFLPFSTAAQAKTLAPARALLDAFGYFDYVPSTCEYAIPTQENKKEIELNQVEKKVIVYPNPTRNYLFVVKTIGQQDYLRLTFRNSIGVVVLKSNMEEFDTYLKIEVSSLISGIYYLEVESGNQSQVHCVVVQ